MDHGLQWWLMDELAAGWEAQARLREELADMTARADALDHLYGVERGAHHIAAAQYVDMRQRAIRAGVRRLTLQRENDEHVETITRLESVIRLAEQEGQALARALRRANLQLQLQASDGWIAAKRPKHS